MRRMTCLALALLLGAGLALAGFADAGTTLRVVFPGTSETEKQGAVRLKQLAESKFPDIKVEMMYLGWPDLEKKLSVMLPGGDVPDLVQQQEATTLVAMGALEPLDGYLARPDSVLKKEQFYEGVWNYSLYDGKVHTIPIRAISYGLIVREDLLTQAGMKLSDLKTWDDLKKAAKAMTKGDVYGYGYPLGLPRFAWREGPYIAGYSDNFDISDTGEATKPKYLELLRLFKDLQPSMSPTTKVMGLREAFQTWGLGNIAMMPTGDFFVANLYPINPKILKVSRVVAYPKGPSAQKPWAPVANVGWAMFKGSKNKEAAWKVLQFFCGLENLTEESAMLNTPARRDIDMAKLSQAAAKFYPDAVEDNKRIIGDFVANAHPIGVPMRKILRREEMEVAFQKVMIEMLDGKLTPEQAYDRIKAEIDRIKRG
ncbi:MAG TPA: sugar ABC transporter substrate-binding protein [Candidatus Methylomirabilis sp.]|nr:sugar ABC transporter substrate-binding protein [Candidatus Methylomirabilis sp.]